MDILFLDGKSLRIEQVIQVAYHNKQVEIKESALAKVKESRAYIEKKIAEDEIIYGVTTGFGSNVDKIVKGEDAIELQTNLLRSHACGVGEPFSKEITRAIMVIRLNTLLLGYSGIQLSTVQLLKDLLNHQIHPVIPSQGSVGASGDLCPLAHMSLALIGEGGVEYQGKKIPSEAALKKCGLQKIRLSHKEGIALSNGTTVMNALGVLAIGESKKLLKLSCLVSTLAFEGLCARKQAFDMKIHKVRNHGGQIQLAKWFSQYIKSSDFIGLDAQKILGKFPKNILKNLPEKHAREIREIEAGIPKNLSANFFKHLPENKEGEPEWKSWETILKFANRKNVPQDSYSVRCSPQVMGASWEAILHIEKVMQGELNAVVDNPIIFTEQDEILSGGNFHGQPLALTLDYLKLALAEIGNLLERQTNKLVDPATNDFLPAMLIKATGLHSGLMIPQYVSASLVSENKVLVHPASADSIPTCANQEDHVSMGTIAGRQAMEILGNVKKIVAILMITAAQSVDLRKEQLEKCKINLKQGKETLLLHEKLRSLVPYLEKDRFLYEDIHLLLQNFDAFYELAE